MRAAAWMPGRAWRRRRKRGKSAWEPSNEGMPQFSRPRTAGLAALALGNAPAAMTAALALIQHHPYSVGDICRMIGDLISYSAPFRTAGIRSKPGRIVTFSGRNFLPHHEPMMTSGSRAMISSAVTIRSLADLPADRSAKMSMPPATSINSDTQAMPEIIGSSHSSK